MTRHEHTDSGLGRLDWQTPATIDDDDDAYQPARQLTNFVQPKRELPAPPTTLSAEQDDAAFAGAVATALNSGAGGVFEHTSAVDRTRADLWRSGGYALFGTVGIAGAMIATMGGVSVGWFPAAVGMLGIIAMAVVHTASLRHSQAGVARHKVDTVRGMAKDRLDSRERLARDLTQAWVRLAESQWDHEEAMERERRRGKK